MIEREWIGGLPPRMAALPRDKRGFPVPAFVRWFNGAPNFAVVDIHHVERCFQQNRCWICGDKMGAYKCFVVGPMCCVNRVSAEPPSHRDCAIFAALNCPFLSRPMAKRGEVPEGAKSAGIMIDRNPGVCAIWTTKSYQVRPEGEGYLFNPHEPTSLEFYANARPATRLEVEEAVLSGLPLLEAYIFNKQDAEQLATMVKRFAGLLQKFPIPEEFMA